PSSAIMAPPDPSSPAAPTRIFISYQRDVEPGLSLAQFLYQSLSGPRCRVFKDVEGIPTGADYSELITSEIIGSDCFIVLLSKSSVAQDWVAAETLTAKSSSDQAGRPKILPVRVAYTENLPLRFMAAIGSLQHFAWRDASDDATLLSKLVEIIHQGTPPTSALVRGEHFIVSEPGGAAGGVRGSLAGPTIVPVRAGEDPSLSVTRGTGPALFRAKVQESGSLEVAIWSGADHRLVESQPGKFITMLEGDT